MTTVKQTKEPDPPTRVIEGVECTNRAGIAALAGWKPGQSVTVRAGTDPDFPRPIGGQKIGREFWYPMPDVDAYLAILAQRAAAKKPPPVKAGDPGDLLNPDDAADAMHIQPNTFRSYVRYSKPFWDGEKQGRPLIPPPDVTTDYVDDDGIPRHRREWYRETLAAHQALRPGAGTGAGRPTSASRQR